MKELEFIEIIKKTSNSSFLGDDCAYLKDFGLVITQDNFVENVHFKRKWATPYQIGYKAAAVNISDILASGAEPKYLSVGLSIPNDINNDFIKELYRGIIAGSYGAEITGGDITSAERIFISITALGATKNRKISSRKNAKVGYKIITTGKYGISTIGLKELIDGKRSSANISEHLEPKINVEFPTQIATDITQDYAMMDTSDGLADALFKIAQASNVTIKSDYINGMFGAEDYNIVAAVPEEIIHKIKDCYIIGKVCNFNGNFLEIDGKQFKNYDDLGLFDHFGGQNI